MMPARAENLGRLIARSDARDLLAVAEEETRRLERLIDDPAAVSAHVEHDARRALLRQVRDCCSDFLRRVLVERLERDVADVVAEDSAVSNGGNVNDAASESELDRLRDGGSRIRHAHLRA